MSSLTVTSWPNLILGCGYLGRRVASRWIHAGKRVAALTRQNSQAIAALGAEPVIGDILDPLSLRALPSAATVLYAVGMDRTSGKSMREVYLNGLGHVLSTIPQCDRFVYISSTSVYGQTDGRIVDEQSPTEPTEESGQIVLEAEKLLRERKPDAVILRFAGIYGPGRLLRRQSQLQSGEPIAGDPNRSLNLIHVDDGAEAVLAAEAHAVPGETYNISDDDPPTRQDFYTLLAELHGAPRPVFDDRPDPRANKRRVSNAKARAMLNWQLKFRSYREGLPHAVVESTP